MKHEQGTWQILMGNLSPMVLVREAKQIIGGPKPQGTWQILLGDLSPIRTYA
jgi:hypothetical protein